MFSTRPNLAGVQGFEPWYAASKAAVLPVERHPSGGREGIRTLMPKRLILSQVRMPFRHSPELVAGAGLEPAVFPERVAALQAAALASERPSR